MKIYSCRIKLCPYTTPQTQIPAIRHSFDLVSSILVDIILMASYVFQILKQFISIILLYSFLIFLIRGFPTCTKFYICFTTGTIQITKSSNPRRVLSSTPHLSHLLNIFLSTSLSFTSLYYVILTN